MTAITDAAGRTKKYTYERCGPPDPGAQDAALRNWQYTYDKIGRLTAITDPLGKTTGYAYDAPAT